MPCFVINSFYFCFSQAKYEFGIHFNLFFSTGYLTFERILLSVCSVIPIGTFCSVLNHKSLSNGANKLWFHMYSIYSS
uniref:Uncharacterized protein n=1 Tax=Anguilla anguilla TaxID=7936 RepID=A0A0E9WZE8_ANGAN